MRRIRSITLYVSDVAPSLVGEVLRMGAGGASHEHRLVAGRQRVALAARPPLRHAVDEIELELPATAGDGAPPEARAVALIALEIDARRW
jgi:hypothetical protein